MELRFCVKAGGAGPLDAPTQTRKMFAPIAVHVKHVAGCNYQKAIYNLR
jgi:hypothetical protein